MCINDPVTGELITDIEMIKKKKFRTLCKNSYQESLEGRRCKGENGEANMA